MVRILANGLCKPSSVSEPISAQHCFLQGMECQNYVGKRQLNKINYLRTSKKCERFLDLKAARLLVLKYSVRAGWLKQSWKILADHMRAKNNRAMTGKITRAEWTVCTRMLYIYIYVCVCVRHRRASYARKMPMSFRKMVHPVAAEVLQINFEG